MHRAKVRARAGVSLPSPVIVSRAKLSVSRATCAGSRATLSHGAGSGERMAGQEPFYTESIISEFLFSLEGNPA